MTFDIVILDPAAYKPYDSLTLETEPLGGTEASIVRLAEALGALGVRVAVLAKAIDRVSLGNNNVFFLPLSYVDKIDCDVLLSVRGTMGFSKFEKAIKFSWHHDLPCKELVDMTAKFVYHDVTVVGVSKWHARAISQWLHSDQDNQNPRVAYVYNPVAKEVFIKPDIELKYDKNKMVWTSSPHKGLSEALTLFAKVKEQIPSMQLHCYNPGYFSHTEVPQDGVYWHGPQAAPKVWQAVSESLCLFYPCQFDETFGLVAAEANGLHTPVLTYPRAALAESVCPTNTFVPLDNTEAFVNTAIAWYNGNRPTVAAQLQFHPEEVAKQWLSLIKSKKQELG